MSETTFEPVWIVNDQGELGVRIGDKFYFLYKGESIVYNPPLHEDGTPMLFRRVGKREFGETCQPFRFVLNNQPIPEPYLEPCLPSPGSVPSPTDGEYEWRPISEFQGP